MTTVPVGQQPSNTPVLGDWQPLPTAGAPTPPSTHRTPKTLVALATLTVATGLYAGVGGPLRLLTLDQTGRRIALCTAAAAALVLLAAALISATRNAITKTKNSDAESPSAGQAAVTIGALVCTGVGINTAWGFTHTHLNITDTFTRIALCGTGEIVLIALGLAARDNLKRDNAPGMPGLLVWIITGFLAVPAFAEGAATAEGFWQGLTAGAWRAVFGPIGAALLWHLAMGLEIRAADATARSMSVLARLGRRLSQKILATFGVADTDTTTTELLRQRARVKAANLTDRYDALSDKRKGGWRGRWIRRQLRAALRAANVAHDPAQKTALLDDLAVSAHAPTLARLDHSNPWGLPTKPEDTETSLATRQISTPAVSPQKETRGTVSPQRAETPRTGTETSPARRAETIETTETVVSRDQGDRGTNTETETGDRSPGTTNPAETSETETRSKVSRTSLPRETTSVSAIGDRETETRALVSLMRSRNGHMKVSLDDAIETTGRPKSTAAKRLKTARDLYLAETTGSGETETTVSEAAGDLKTTETA
ncbi:hypothetical protein [Streptomyces sp. NRRL F-5135]|uniref:hypothetical protein n=1 Tax=Streptomyces sp. NRRL F-5135 TaxID=1463858 RepID=UPI0004CBD746|nr:hypothetical protein [Streptomyces sp. NRRL F-5135]